MPVDLNDLLIFKNRKDEKLKKKKAAQQAQQVQVQKPAEPAPKVEEPTPTQVLQPQKAEEISVPEVAMLPPAPQAPPQVYIEQPKPTGISDEIPYRPPKKVELPDEQLGKKAAGYGSKRAKIRRMRELAETMTCELHPWRKGYAICDYCKRAFCYEDIVEEAGTFYCIDDMDKIPASAKAVKVVSYGKMSALSVLCYVSVLAIFVITQYTQLSMFITEALSATVTSAPLYTVALANPTFSITLLIAVLSFISGAMVMFGSKSSIRIASTVGIFGGIFFAYLYATTFIPAAAVYAGIEFTAVLLLVYSRSYYEAAAKQAESVGIPVMETHPSI